jgi:hypothetical protein
MAQLIVLKRGCCATVAWALLAALGLSAATHAAEVQPVRSDGRDRLVYERDANGDAIPDFSHCGYEMADVEIPAVRASIVVRPADGDDGRRIQDAIDSLAKLPVGPGGFRGAILLAPGQFEVGGQLVINHSGIVLRGSGAGEGGTTIKATGIDRRPLLRIEGRNDRATKGQKYRVVDQRVSVGEDKLQLDTVKRLAVGDRVIVTRPSTREWIKALGADAFGVGWRSGTRDIRWDRRVTSIDGHTITLNAPITTAIEASLGGAVVEPYDWSGRISHVGIEDVTLESSFDHDQPEDEEHAWFGITIQNVENAWVRRVEFRHFTGGAVSLFENTSAITIQDCLALEPVSESAGYRRHTFSTQGQLTLFLRCWSERGRHDFAVGHCAPGPNAFVNCYAREALGDSGPIESWASGVLYDNVHIDGAGLNLNNRWTNPPGCGWTAANCVLWQCQAGAIHVARPTTANNWSIGVWSTFAGDGTFFGRSDFVRPLSLYQAQLAVRRGKAAATDIETGLIDPVGATNPTLAEAAEFVAQSKKPPRQLIDLIRENFKKGAMSKGALSMPIEKDGVIENPESATNAVTANVRKLEIKNGYLVTGGQLKTGGLMDQPFWRGTVRPSEQSAYPPALTRFFPGRTGPGFTDDLAQVADAMLAKNIAAFDHHYGLWYDRRRDEHTMVRQPSGDVAPPFFEQPFARTGPGSTWSGLNKYDLTKFNAWYWRRLRDFAKLCDERGLVLIHENYFQHNILEAGAHWADSPWRPANNVNQTNLPEPPPYIGGKRIFIAPTFYDVSDPARRALHRGYIRQCLDNFADSSNVIQATSAEYSGPLEFTRFWLETIIEWEREHGKNVLVTLSAPKDVQDEILADAELARHVDVIDIRYWAYTAGDGIYEPRGGLNLSPRQHLRQTELKSGGFDAIVKAVREYRTRYPDKAVTYYADLNCPSSRDGWAVLVGGGSLPNVSLPERLANVIPKLRPTDGVVSDEGQWCLGNDQLGYLIYVANENQEIEVTIPDRLLRYRVRWIDARSGELQAGEDVGANPPLRLPAKTNVLWLERRSAK